MAKQEDYRAENHLIISSNAEDQIIHQYLPEGSLISVMRSGFVRALMAARLGFNCFIGLACAAYIANR